MEFERVPERKFPQRDRTSPCCDRFPPNVIKILPCRDRLSRDTETGHYEGRNDLENHKNFRNNF